MTMALTSAGNGRSFGPPCPWLRQSWRKSASAPATAGAAMEVPQAGVRLSSFAL
jgi:hypothetical protein